MYITQYELLNRIIEYGHFLKAIFILRSIIMDLKADIDLIKSE